LEQSLIVTIALDVPQVRKFQKDNHMGTLSHATSLSKAWTTPKGLKSM
jgi:hypothetical protein